MTPLCQLPSFIGARWSLGSIASCLMAYQKVVKDGSWLLDTPRASFGLLVVCRLPVWKALRILTSSTVGSWCSKRFEAQQSADAIDSWILQPASESQMLSRLRCKTLLKKHVAFALTIPRAETLLLEMLFRARFRCLSRLGSRMSLGCFNAQAVEIYRRWDAQGLPRPYGVLDRGQVH